jgi:hypothetical protein
MKEWFTRVWVQLQNAFDAIFHARTPILVFVWFPLFICYWFLYPFAYLHEKVTAMANRVDAYMMELQK